MDLTQIEHFIAVAEEGHFTRAAERVGRTQSAVSLSVRKLEDELDTPLFDRTSPRVALTDAGRQLLESARSLVSVRNNALQQLRDLQDLRSGNLTIAAHESAAVYLLPAPLREYFRLFPHVTVGIERSRLEDIPRQVMDRAVDIGFVKDVPSFHELRSIPVHSDEMVLIAAPGHRFAKRSRVAVRDLANEPFVLHHQCAATAKKILALFESYQTTCRIVAELWSFENVKDFVRHEVGLAIVPGVCVQHELETGRLIKLPCDGLAMPRQTVMIFRDQPNYQGEPANRFIEVIQRLTLHSNPTRRGDVTSITAQPVLRKLS